MKTFLIVLITGFVAVSAKRNIIHGKAKRMFLTSPGCLYKSQIYQQGQTWRDGCELSCHCLDNLSGQYTCNELCLRWDLPSQCHMQPPVRGKCCAKPYCPAGFTINYPPGYQDV